MCESDSRLRGEVNGAPGYDSNFEIAELEMHIIAACVAALFGNLQKRSSMSNTLNENDRRWFRSPPLIGEVRIGVVEFKRCCAERTID
jgi:hypothetical protein